MNQTIESSASINKGPRSNLSRDNSNYRNSRAQLSNRMTIDSTVTKTASVKTN